MKGRARRQYLHDHILQAYSGAPESHGRLAERRSGVLGSHGGHALGDADSLEITGNDVMSAFYAQVQLRPDLASGRTRGTPPCTY